MMSRLVAFRWPLAAAGLLLFGAIALVADWWLTLPVGARWALWGLLLLLGAAAAAAIAWFLRPLDGSAPGGRQAGPDDILLAFRDAAKRLGRAMGDGPLVLVLGPTGSAKTALVAHGGGDPELVVGEAPRLPTELPAPTPAANVWVANGTVITEVTGALLDDGPRWLRVLGALQPPRWAAVLGRKDAPPRTAVVCVPCDLFYQGGGGEALDTLAALLRLRLAEGARAFGQALPVYVVFTRMDRIPFFQPWVAGATADALLAPLGATLPLDAHGSAGTHADRLTPRVVSAFSQLARAIGAQRGAMLRRGLSLPPRWDAFEWPRELGKLQDKVVRLLVELSRPTQLGASHQLRGFYFVGARPVIAADLVAARPGPAGAAPASGTFGATSVLSRADAVPAAPTRPQEREIPEWTFLRRFLPEVVLADPSARVVAQGGVRVHRTRRALASAAIAALLLLCVGIVGSYAGNRSRLAQVDAAAAAMLAYPVAEVAPGAPVSTDALKRLEALRQVLDTLRAQETAHPWAGLGLWSGGRAVEAARPAWHTPFRRLLLAEVRQALHDSLRTLPPAPGPTDDYDRQYDRFKAYLILTQSAERSTVPELAPVLDSVWHEQRRGLVDAEQSALARRQFTFFASDLAVFHPWNDAADAIAIQQARRFLGAFTGSDPHYRALLARANRAIPELELQGATPPRFLTVRPARMPGAFTARGFAYVRDSVLRTWNPAQEEWVLGSATQALSPDARTAMRRELQGRFLDDYQRAWRDVLQQSSVGRGSGLAGVREVVQAVSSGTTSPVLRLLQVVAVQTGVTPEIQAAFQPVRQVATADLQGKLAAEKAVPYLTQLGGLVASLGSLETAQRVAMAARDSATVLAFTQQTLLAAETATVPARGAVTELVSGFAQGALDGVGAGVERLLTAPIADVQAALQAAASLRPRRAVARGGGGGGGGPPPPPPGTTPALLNARGQSFCTALGAMTAKFPFTPTAVEEASPAEVARLLAPGTGELWTFHGDRLAAFLVKEGAQWVARPAAGIALSPAFVAFFNQAARLSDALFVDGAQTPRLGFTVLGVSAGRDQTVTLLHGGKESRFGEGAGDAVISWPTDGGLEAKVSAVFVRRFARKQRWDLSASGDWALFRLTARARSVTPDGTVTWATGGRPDVVLKFTNARAALPLLRRGWMGDQLGCVAQVTQ